MLSLTLFLQGLFQVSLVMIGVFRVWQLVSSTKGFMTRLLGLIVVITCALAYYYPHLLGG